MYGKYNHLLVIVVAVIENMQVINRFWMIEESKQRYHF